MYIFDNSSSAECRDIKKVTCSYNLNGFDGVFDLEKSALRTESVHPSIILASRQKHIVRECLALIAFTASYLNAQSVWTDGAQMQAILLSLASELACTV